MRDLRAQEESKPEEKLLIFIKPGQSSQQNLAKETYTYTAGSEVHASGRNNLEKHGNEAGSPLYTLYVHTAVSTLVLPLQEQLSTFFSNIFPPGPDIHRGSGYLSTACCRDKEASSRGERCTCSLLVKGMVFMTAMTC